MTRDALDLIEELQALRRLAKHRGYTRTERAIEDAIEAARRETQQSLARELVPNALVMRSRP